MASIKVLGKAAGIIGVIGGAGYAAFTTFKDGILSEAQTAYLSQFPNDSNFEDSNTWNKFRHSYTSAKLTRLYGDDVAQLMMDMNEVRPNNDPHERDIDYYNNDLGAKKAEGRVANMV